ncbi:Gfo/Idh/MocA family oxidoreductase [Pollutibacter soli]|uniref:Gfo/Idh/MocA family protein n=1 Tax=Pollutibacter soli TaxID=3034157 RepID=UPI00301413B1
MKIISRRKFISYSGIGAAATALQVQNSRPIMDQTKKINIALVGLGRYATYLAEGIDTAKYCRVAGIVTGTPSKAETWKKKYNIPGKNIYNYQNFDNIASNKDIDLIYVVLPNAMHKEYVIRAAKAGKHVIVEKPMAITATDCREMIEACKKAGVQLAMGYRLHYEPYHMELMRLGQQKVFGNVKVMEASLGYKSEDPKQWRHNKTLAGGGPLMNLGVYCVQVARYVTGEEPLTVTAQFGPVTRPDLFAEVEESITWQLQFPGGAMCNSITTYNSQIDRFYAGAEKGSFELSPAISYGPFIGKTSDGPLNFPATNQQQVQCDEICKKILAKESLPSHITGEEGWKDMKVLEAIYASALSGGTKTQIN